MFVCLFVRCLFVCLLLLLLLVMLLLLLLVVVVVEPPRITEGSVAVLTRPGVQTLEARNRLLS